MDGTFLRIFKSKKGYQFLFRILVSVSIFIGSNHCVFEEALSSFICFATKTEKISHLPNHVGSNSPHRHQGSNSEESHSHGQPHPMFLLGLGQAIFLVLRFLGLVLISSMLLTFNFSFLFKKIYLELNPSRIFEWDFSKFHSSIQVHSIVSPRAPPSFS